MASTENGASPCLSFGTGIWWSRGEVEQVGARLERPVAPWRDDLDVGVERIGRQLEADLVVALAGRAMRDRVGARFPGDLDQVLGDQRPGDRRAEQIEPFILRVGAEHREDEVAHELLAHVDDADVLDAEQLGLLARRLQLAALAEVGGEGDDLGAELGLQPFEDDRGVEPARIGEHDLLHVPMFRHRCPRQRFRRSFSRTARVRKFALSRAATREGPLGQHSECCEHDQRRKPAQHDVGEVVAAERHTQPGGRARAIAQMPMPPCRADAAAKRNEADQPEDRRCLARHERAIVGTGIRPFAGWHERQRAAEQIGRSRPWPAPIFLEEDVHDQAGTDEQGRKRRERETNASVGETRPAARSRARIATTTTATTTGR